MDSARRHASPPSAFLLNVARVGESHGIRFDSKIVDEQGVEVVAAGTVVNPDATRRVIEAAAQARVHLRLPRRLDRHHLRGRLRELPERYPDIAALEGASGTGEHLNRCLNRLSLSPSLVELLTLTDLRSPEVMERTLAGIWLAMLVAREMDLKRDDLDVVFLAALARDLGQLFLDPKILDARGPGELDRAGRTLLRSHAQLAAVAIEKPQRVGPDVLEAIRFHHARVDGSGYPPLPSGLSLGLPAQIVGFADTLAEARVADGLGMGQMRRVLLLNLERFDEGLVATFGHLVDRAGIDVSSDEDDDARLALLEAMLARALELEEAYAELDEELNGGHLARRLPKRSPLIRVARELMRVMQRSGHGSAELRWWLKAVRAGRDDVPWTELVDVDLHQRELTKELGRLQQAIEEVAPWTRSEVVGPELL